MSDEPVVWIDGRLVPPDEAKVSAFDHGLIAGDGAFESLKIVEGTPFAMGRHIRRLHTTLAALAIVPPREGELRRAMQEVTAANGTTTGKLRLTVTGGVGPLGSGTPEGPPLVVAAVQPLAQPPEPVAVTVPWTRNETGALAGLKTTSYAENVRALGYAHEMRAGEALFANTKGELCEGTGTNVFVAIDGRIQTPPLSSGCLAGITRELVLEVADVSEVEMNLNVLESADEVFLTSSTRNVQALARVDDRLLGEPGPLALSAAAAFEALAASQIDP